MNSKQSRFSFLKQVDLFGQKLMFEEYDVQTHKTVVGAIFTYLVFLTLIVIGFLFGKEIYQRKTPNLMDTEEIVTPDIANVDLREFPIFFQFSDLYGANIPIDIHTIVNILIFYFTTDSNSVLSYELLYGFTECDSSYYTKHQDLVEEYISNAKETNKTIYCINHKSQVDFKLAYPLLSINSTNIKLYINDCTNSQKQGSYPYFKNKDDYNISDLANCLDNETLAYYLQKLILRIDFIDSFYNFKDYHTPEVSDFSSITKQITKGASYTSTLFELGIKQLLSDKSWIFESYEETKIPYYRSSLNEYLKPTDFTKELFTLSIEVSKKMHISTRSYMKIQDLFARIGGFYNAISIIINIILYDYVKFKFKSNYSKYTVDITNFDDHEKLNVSKFCQINDNSKIDLENSFKNRDMMKKIEQRKSIDKFKQFCIHNTHDNKSNNKIFNLNLNMNKPTNSNLININEMNLFNSKNNNLNNHNNHNELRDIINKEKTKDYNDSHNFELIRENYLKRTLTQNNNKNNNKDNNNNASYASNNNEKRKLADNSVIMIANKPRSSNNMKETLTNNYINIRDNFNKSRNIRSIESPKAKNSGKNIANSLFLPEDVVYFNYINFIEDDATDFKRNALLNNIKTLSYYNFIKGRFHFYFCCKNKTNLGTLLLIDSKTVKNYSLVNYFQKIKKLCNFENNINDIKNRVYNLSEQ